MGLQRVRSRENKRLIGARKVRDGKDRDLVFIEGRRLVGEALSSGIQIVECFIVEGFSDQELLASIQKLNIDIVELPPTLFRSLAATDQPQGIILLADRPVGSLKITNWRRYRVPLYLYLSEVSNPSNLGAILRTVEAAGAAGVFTSMNSADAFSPKSIRASMGAAFRVPVSPESNIEGVVLSARAAGVKCLALDAAADKSYLDVDWKKPHVLICGSEAHGLTEREFDLVDATVSIPMEPPVESLNLAVAAGIILFEARRRNAG